MTAYTAQDAHDDGRHASTHPDDRKFWAKSCPSCARAFDALGLPRLSRSHTADVSARFGLV